MAMLLQNNYNSSKSSTSHVARKTSTESSHRSNAPQQASAYVAQRGGGFEDGSGVGDPGPGKNGSASARTSPSSLRRRRSADAACHITEECERLFCGVLRAVFLVEKSAGLRDPLVVDSRLMKKGGFAADGKAVVAPDIQQQRTIMRHDLPTPSPSPDGKIHPLQAGLVSEYVEVFDYAGGLRFRGFVAEKRDERCLFIFFDQEVMMQDLKPGLMTLLELAGCDDLACDRLIVGIDREAGAEEVEDVSRDLGWVGFELTTLEPWSGTKGTVSDRWLFLSMDV